VFARAWDRFALKANFLLIMILAGLTAVLVVYLIVAFDEITWYVCVVTLWCLLCVCGDAVVSVVTLC